jgi:hypothetical protein
MRTVKRYSRFFISPVSGRSSVAIHDTFPRPKTYLFADGGAAHAEVSFNESEQTKCRTSGRAKAQR